ncbi:hypothetical protein [Bradyrhizobium sp.]|uniref:hypothetical protein n=1 Tax=Bradyrhizobium sp. TaxID=376 RepID=UPI003C292CCA
MYYFAEHFSESPDPNEKSVVPEMTQDTQARPSAARRKNQSAPPGIGLTMAIAVISGVVCWFWLASGRANPVRSTAPNVSDLTEVEEREIAGALTTMSLSNAGLAQFREGKDGGCRRPLAWVSLVSAPGEPPSHVRLISGTYYSPIFEVSATPVRVALPFPAPYETGHGALTAIDVGASAIISLLPAWRVSAQDGKTTREVSWRPVKSCGPRNG